MKQRKETQTNGIAADDPAMIAEIVRQVLNRLGVSPQPTGTTPQVEAKAPGKTATAAINDKIITSQIINELHESTAQIFVNPSAIITPAARDDARSQDIKIVRTIQLPAGQQTQHEKTEIIDEAQPDRAEAVRQQLATRGITTGTGKIVLTETPAKEVHFQCSKNNETAVMIGSFNEIKRFSDEITPTVWVLDMQRLTFSAAVNAVVQISKTRRADR